MPCVVCITQSESFQGMTTGRPILGLVLFDCALRVVAQASRWFEGRDGPSGAFELRIDSTLPGLPFTFHTAIDYSASKYEVAKSMARLPSGQFRDFASFALN